MITGMADAGIDLQRQVDPRLQLDEPMPSVDFSQWRTRLVYSLVAAKESAKSETEFLRHVGSMTGVAPAADQVDRRHVIARRLPVHRWPEQPLLVVAVNADSGERCVFDRTSNVELIDAVAASCAVAGIWPATVIKGARYIDGRFYSIDNADLATGSDRVVILTLPARVPPLCVSSLDVAVEQLQRHDARVEVVLPDESSQAAFASVGGNLLDPALRETAGRAGRAQGRAVAQHVASFWQERVNGQDP